MGHRKVRFQVPQSKGCLLDAEFSLTLDTMKSRIPCLVAVLLSAIPVFAQGTAFTYQGQLNNNGTPAQGIYDLRFTVYDSTNAPGVLIAGPVTNAATGISNG